MSKSRMVVVLAITLLSSHDSWAGYVFQPYQCMTCPTLTEIDWKFQVSDPVWELPTDPNCAPGGPGGACPHYINFIKHTRYVSANQYVKQFGFRVDFFETELNWDLLWYGAAAGPIAGVLSGTLGMGWYDTAVTGSLQSNPFSFYFDADGSSTARGFTLGKARVCCQSTPYTDPTYVRSHRRHTGVLLATHDVVYFYAPVNHLCSDQHDSIAMWGQPGKDFDLYVRCNALPSATQYDFRGASSGPQEFVHMPAGACPSGGTWYIAVQSYSGAGWFNLVRHTHYATQHRQLRAGTDFAATAEQLAGFADALRQGAKAFFGATEGTQYIERIDLYNSSTCGSCGGQYCDICFLNNPDGTAGSPICPNPDPGPNGYTEVYIPRWYDPETLAHEWGHHYFCLGDEYCKDGTCTNKCGHSMMAQEHGANNNYCYHESVLNDHDHGEDRAPPSTPPPTGISAWECAYDHYRTPWKPDQTPDNYDYRDFDFGNQVGNVVVH